MIIQKVGKAKPDALNGFWIVETRSMRFQTNPRVVEGRPEVKKVRSRYQKAATKHVPRTRRIGRREAHFQERDEARAELQKTLKQVYSNILEESFTYPVALKKDKDYAHHGDWRYGLYQGIVYQFDRPDYPGDEMMRQIHERP